MTSTLTTIIRPFAQEPTVIIDLTEDPTPSPPAVAPSASYRDGHEPPRKRQRVDVTDVRQPRNLKLCLKEQVFPHVDARLREIPADEVDVRQLGIDVVNALVNERGFQEEFRQTEGYLSTQFEATFAGKASREVDKLRWLQKYQLSRSRTPRRDPETQTLSFETPDIKPIIRILPSHQKKSRNPATVQTSPLSYRSKARALAWKSWKTHRPTSKSSSPQPQSKSKLLSLSRKPYRTGEERRTIIQGTSSLLHLAPSLRELPQTYHIDFSPQEIECVRHEFRRFIGRGESNRAPLRDLSRLLRKHLTAVSQLPLQIQLKGALAKRDADAIHNFLNDVHKRQTSRDQLALTLEVDEFDKQAEAIRSSRIPSLLLARELEGNRGFGSMRRHVNFTNEFRQAREDVLELQAEWTNCAGDIQTIAWVSNDNFICGTTTHSDSHNQQYNKEGNLLLCSSASGTLKAYPDHRIIRPFVETGDNSTEAMRESQSPWLYASVASSDYDKAHDRAFTSSFDKTVKAWKVDKSGRAMHLLGTWEHGGNVNFVAASKHASGMVATASDVPTQAVRIYRVNDADLSESPYTAFSGMKVQDEDNGEVSQKWGYFPATMQWGLVKDVQHLLLVGYSPRSLTWYDNDIPEDKLNSGEICLWDGLTGNKIRVMTATTQNVFEVAWHPSQPSFIVATSPCGLMIEDNVRTQIRIFRPSDNPELIGAFSEVQCLDCYALDINELTIMPNSMTYCYVTAACTDGKVYVWDTARGDKPIHILCHGDPVEEFGGDREKEDTGVKFTAWGTSMDRLYTGASDGVVKVWNVRSKGDPLIRDLLEVSGPVSCAMFSPDASKLAVGDASGRVYLLSLDKEDEPPANFITVPKVSGPKPANQRPVRRPKLFEAHPEPPPPAGTEPPVLDMATQFLESGQLVLHPSRIIGAVQGPNYSSTGLFRKEAHLDGDPSQALLAAIDGQQQENAKMFSGQRRFPKLRQVSGWPTALYFHQWNIALDLDLKSLPLETKLDLAMAGIKWDKVEDEVEDWGFEYED